MNQKQLDQISEIKQLAIETSGKSATDENMLLRIIGICNQIEIDQQIKKRLEAEKIIRRKVSQHHNKYDKRKVIGKIKNGKRSSGIY